jgi:toxin YoeB
MRSGAGLVTWEIVFTKQAQKDARKVAEAGLKNKVSELLEVIRENPFHTSPRFEKLVGDLAGAYSRRITIQHRLVYEVLEEQKIIKIIRMWTHYE